MKASLRKMRGFGLHQHGGEHRRKDIGDLRHPLAQLDELAQASQDMQEMRDCYDSLLSAAAATANSAYEFSESFREMGACLLEKTALNDDEESGKVLLMLGKVQFEIQKFVDSYRTHIFQTITIPSESLLNELRTVEEMKQQYDEKREVYEHMLMRQREKGKGTSGKGECFSMQQIQAAHEDCDEEATLFVFRLKSLKQGQSRSLLTQVARHHAAQLCFFKKALKSLEAVEPHVKLVTEQQHIDYHFSGLEDDDGVADDDHYDSENTTDTHEDRELSFDYGQNDQELDVSASRNSIGLDVDITFPRVSPEKVAKENIDGNYRKSFSLRGAIRTGSQSAPLFAENKPDIAEKMKQMRASSARKFNTYVLPTPVDTKKSSTGSGNQVPQAMKTSSNAHNVWHSSPLVGNKEKSRSLPISAQAVLKESNNNTTSAPLPPPSEGLFLSKADPLVAADFKKIKRHAFSGPINRNLSPTRPVTLEPPQLFSGPLLQNPPSQAPSTSPKLSVRVSPSASPTLMSSPKISELHELPRPPGKITTKSSRPFSLIGHSAPLPKGAMLPFTSKPLVSSTAAPLPTPAQAMIRSFSIPSSSLRPMELNFPKPIEGTNNSDMAEDATSPPRPITLSRT